MTFMVFMAVLLVLGENHSTLNLFFILETVVWTVVRGKSMPCECLC